MKIHTLTLYYSFLSWIFCISTLSVFASEGSSPIRFVENKGQWPDQVKLRAELPGGYLFINDNQLQYSFYDAKAVSTFFHAHTEEELEFVRNTQTVRAHSFTIDFVGATSAAQISKEDKNALYYNYFLGNDPSKWAAEAATYQKVRYADLYEGIDMVLYPQDHALKYEFYVAPNSDYKKIQMKYQHMDKLSIKEDGSLLIETSVNHIVEQKPYCFQIISGREVEVKSAFILRNNTVSFELIGNYDPTLPLIIDPLLVFSTFSGSLSDNWGNAATYDNKGNLYSAGTVFGQQFPVTAGSFDVSFSSYIDAGILKYTSSGNGLLFGTFIGGNEGDVPHSMNVNAQNQLILMGTTSSMNFPITTGAFDNTFGGGDPFSPLGGINYALGCDIFVVKLSEIGHQLLASTYLGGSQNDGANYFGEALTRNYGDQFRGDVIIDEDENIIVASLTKSVNFPLINSGFNQFSGGQMATLTKFNSSLTSVAFSTWYGGGGLDAAYSVRLNSQNEIYIGGGTNSNNLSTHSISYDPSYNEAIDGFIARFTSNGTFLGATYIGNLFYNQIYFVDIDVEDNVYAYGQTRGVFPITPGTYNNPNSGQFIIKMNRLLSSLEFSTTIGSGRQNPDISPTAFMVNDCGFIYLSGWGGNINNIGGYAGQSSTENMPVTSDAYKSFTDGDDFYVCVLGKNAQSLNYATFFGSVSSQRGDHVDGGTSRFNKHTGTIYHATCACNGNDFPTTPGAWSNTNNSSNCNNAAFKISLDTLSARFTASTLEGCMPLKVDFFNQSFGGTQYQWNFGGLGTSSASGNTSFTFNSAGTYTVQLIAINPSICNGRDTASLEITVLEKNFTISPNKSICKGQSVNLQASGGNSYLWSPSAGLSSTTSPNVVATPTSSTTYSCKIKNQFGCEETLTVSVTVLEEILADFELQVPDPCDFPPEVLITNNSSSGSTYFWDFGDGTTSTSEDPGSHVYSATGAYTITLKVLNTVCGDSAVLSKDISVFRNNFIISRDASICKGASVQLEASGATTYQWSPSTGLSSTTISNPIASPLETTTYTVTMTGQGGCVKDTTVKVTVLPDVIADFEIVLEGLCDDLPEVRLVNNSTGATSYFWNFGNGRTSTAENPPVFSYTSDGTYEILLIAKNSNCSDTLKKSIQIFENGFSVGPNQTICYGESTQIFAYGGISYNWLPTTGLSDPTVSNPYANPTTTTTYRVNMVGRGGCEFDTTVTVTVLDELIAKFNVRLENGCDSFPDVYIENESKGADSYFWDFGDGRTSTDENPAPFEYDAEGNYTITLIVNNALCSDTMKVVVENRIDQSALFFRNIRIPEDPTICAGKEGVQLEVSGGNVYTWSPETWLSDPHIPNPIANPPVTTTYSIRIANEGGCFVDSSITVNVLPEIKVAFDYVHSADCGDPAKVFFKNNSENALSYQWILGDGTVVDANELESYTYQHGGTYTVQLIGYNSLCSDTLSVPITVDNVLPPNVITPNGDGSNDAFFIDAGRSGWKLEIYNRWGKLVYESKNYQNDWGGEKASGMYYYFLTSPDGNSCKGWIHVLK